MLRVKDDVIVLQTMMWPDEVRTPDFSVEGGEVKDSEVKMANMLVETLAGDFDASEFEDDYAGAVEALVKAKVEGGEVKRTPTSTKSSGEVVDLLAALQRSVKAAKTARGEDDDADEKPAKKSASKKSASKKSTAKKSAAKKSTSKKTPPRRPRAARRRRRRPAEPPPAQAPWLTGDSRGGTRSRRCLPGEVCRPLALAWPSRGARGAHTRRNALGATRPAPARRERRRVGNPLVDLVEHGVGQPRRDQPEHLADRAHRVAPDDRPVLEHPDDAGGRLVGGQRAAAGVDVGRRDHRACAPARSACW